MGRKKDDKNENKPPKNSDNGEDDDHIVSQPLDELTYRFRKLSYNFVFLQT
ncbi:hypothetical protein KHA80_16050 [Anaerobacillus sp. HL2]|nr:hypothetical protein KHA80_16050 [Anaerobacillus sp. HL2]